MSTALDFVGKIDPVSRTASRVDCQECDLVIPDDVPAYVYFDMSTATYTIRCSACHAGGN